jgi:hypothetical protein
MKNKSWDDIFIEKLYAKYPKKTELIQAMMDLLCIEREAAYRRLRKDVVFHSSEIAKIASAWNISLDEIIDVDSGDFSFMMKPINYLDPSESEFLDLQRIIRRLEHLRTCENSESMDICNKLPRSLTTGFPALFQFEVFRWGYQYGNEEESIPFSKVDISLEMSEEMSYYYQLIKLISNMSYIFDPMLFDYMVREIIYFNSILLITNEDKATLKQELINLLDYLMEVASRGYFPETKKKVNIYISTININTNYSYYYTDQLKICRIHAFDKFDLSTFNTEMVNNFRNWMHLKKRTSIQISEVDERSRVEFFTKQKQLVDAL